ncbi:hypothetical protein [Microbispora rosea]|uniref:hypothetical protein n=1 Tax=Microbispora rosea TaxID=58117 RepID=UPI0033E3AF67
MCICHTRGGLAYGGFPLPRAVNTYACKASVTRNITFFTDDLRGTSVGFSWSARHGTARPARGIQPQREARRTA